MLSRLFWNPVGNERLYMVSCAERLVQAPTDHSVKEIKRRVGQAIGQKQKVRAQFRILFVARIDEVLQHETLYLSAPFTVGGQDAE